MPSDGAANDLFGSSVAISADRIVVGAFGDNNEKGSAYIYTIDGDFLDKIQAPDREIGDKFGWSISISDDTIVVGTPEDRDAGANSGSAHVFTKDGDYIAKLTAPHAAQSDKFGQSLAVSGDIIAVGSYWDDDNGEESGSVYLYDTDGNFIIKLRAPDADTGDRFGVSIDIADDRVIIGSHFNNANTINDGSVYIFDINGTYIDEVMAPGGEQNDNFGWSVSLSGDTIVGASNSGSAYICIEYEC